MSFEANWYTPRHMGKLVSFRPDWFARLAMLLCLLALAMAVATLALSLANDSVADSPSKSIASAVARP